MDIYVITDPINIIYGGYVSEQFEQLRDNGIEVVITDLNKLRDSNVLYSAWWRTWFQWFGVSEGGFLNNVFDVSKQNIGVRSYLSLLNFKANHRKVVITDRVGVDGRNVLSGLVTSANPHDGSSMHSNVAMRFDNNIALDLLESENAILRLSGRDAIPLDRFDMYVDTGDVRVQVLTEGAIKERILQELDGLTDGDELDILMFYLSDRDVVRGIKRVADRGVKVRLILDPSKDAFGRLKNGVPNRQVGYELQKHSSQNIQVRWCNTTGEQCHSKLFIFKKGSETVLIQGSANITKRNIGNFNLETNVLVRYARPSKSLADALELFETGWENRYGRIYTLDYDEYRDSNIFRILQYRLQESTGLSSF